MKIYQRVEFISKIKEEYKLDVRKKINFKKKI